MAEKIGEILAWIGIFLSPVFAAAGIGVVLYIYIGESSMLYIYVIGGIGVVLGIFLAERIRRKRGTNDFMSEIMASKDVHDYNYEQWQKKKSNE